MAKTKSDDSRYESRFGGGYVSPAQYITEIICERFAGKNGKSLPQKFWSTPEHKRSFMMTLLTANALLKMYHPKAIISALRRLPNLYSLKAAWLDDVIKEEQAKIDAFVEQVEVATPPPAEISVTEKPRESFNNKKSTLDKLRDL